ncbi:zinc finger protein 37 homolog [Ctenocephalides felis]|uniref:zinc finger protein 37 homolog n=1 Tax=Ctenocephalides felis TaxID=7515 RepID=UPI000E6E443F|nr:zinc finger protein 37 homolog [Ctenocephalides felis]
MEDASFTKKEINITLEFDRYLLPSTMDDSNYQHMSSTMALNFKPYKCEKCGEIVIFPVASSKPTPKPNQSAIELFDSKSTSKPNLSTIELSDYKPTPKPNQSAIELWDSIRPHKCGKCGVSYKRKSNLKLHIRTNCFQNRRFKCSLCSYRTCRNGDLKVHYEQMYSHYYPLETTNINGPSQGPSQDIFSDVRPHKCIKCGAAYRHKTNLAAHIKNNYQTFGDVFPIKMDPDMQHFNSTSNSLNNSLKPFMCGECGNAYKYKGDLSAHVRKLKFTAYFLKDIDSGVQQLDSTPNSSNKSLKPYMCGFDSYDFVNVEKKPFDLFAENASDGSRLLKPFMCGECGAGYTYKTDLNRHLKTKCNQNKGFGCQFCPYRSYRRANVKQHTIKIHLRPKE